MYAHLTPKCGLSAVVDGASPNIRTKGRFSYTQQEHCLRGDGGDEDSMRLTRASLYALHAVAYMAGQDTNEPTPSHVIADKRKISERFLLKVLKPLVSAQVLISAKGPHGGYRLAKPANQITLLEIMEAVDGPIRGQAAIGNGDTSHPLNQRLTEICQESANHLRKQLKRIRISEVLRD